MKGWTAIEGGGLGCGGEGSVGGSHGDRRMEEREREMGEEEMEDGRGRGRAG